MTEKVVSLHALDNGLPRQLDKLGCKGLVLRLVNEGGRVDFKQHLYDRMEERNVTVTQVYEVLRRGEVIKGPARHTHGWKFTMSADAAGEWVTVGASIETDSFGLSVLVITVF